MPYRVTLHSHQFLVVQPANSTRGPGRVTSSYLRQRSTRQISPVICFDPLPNAANDPPSPEANIGGQCNSWLLASTSMQPWALVSPASRGIGLELARRLLRTTDIPVVATARRDVDQAREQMLDGLQDVQEDRVKILKLDALGKRDEPRCPYHSDLGVDEETIHDAAAEAGKLFPKKDSYLHLSFCVPGLLFPEKAPSQINYEDALLTFRTNTLGPLMLIKHFSPYLPRKSTDLTKTNGLPERAVWATMSARVGSISDNRLGGWYSYRASKAAVNQVTRTFDNHLRTSAGDKAMAVALHPGTVKTGLSKEFWDNVKEEKLFSAEYSAEKLLEVVNSRKDNDRGKCWDWKGEEVSP